MTGHDDGPHCVWCGRASTGAMCAICRQHERQIAEIVYKSERGTLAQVGPSG